MAVDFIKTGKAAQRHFEKQEQESAKRDAEMKVNRFYLPNDEEAKVTFLDGKLNEDGIIDRAIWDEHRIPVPGRKMPRFLMCTAEEETCPLCEQGFQRSTVNAFTVIDHRSWRDERRNKTRKHERKLYLAKRDTMKRLQKLAAKRGGLRGWTVKIGRTGDERSPAAGTDFEFLGKLDVEAFLAKTGLTKDHLRPFKYSEAMVSYTADELRRMGFGSGMAIGEDDVNAMKGKKKSQFENGDDEDEDEDDDFIVKELKPKKKKAVVEDEDVETDEDEDESDVKTKAPVKTVPKKKSVQKVAAADNWFDDDDEPKKADDDEDEDGSPVEDSDIPF